MRRKAEQDYLNRKHRGGEAGAKGTIYEDYYAIFQIVLYIARFEKKLTDVTFITQLQDTYVDDLLIVYPDMRIYHQMKNTDKLTWKTGSARTIRSDFEYQINDCINRKETFRLKLVYSARDSEVGSTIPDTIKDFTTTEYFQYENDLNCMVLSCPEFQRALREISTNSDDSTMDELDNIATVFYGVWKSFGVNNSVSLSAIVDRARMFRYFNLSIFQDDNISEECCSILDKIEGLEYSVKGKMFKWRKASFEGCRPLVEVEKIIQENRPATFSEFMKIL